MSYAPPKGTKWSSGLMTLVIGVMATFAASASPPLDLDHVPDHSVIGEFVAMHTPAKPLTLPEVKALPDSAWIKGKAPTEFHGNEGGPRWFKMTIQNNRSIPLKRILEAGVPLVTVIDLYIDYGDYTETRHSGAHVPFLEREYYHPLFAFGLTFPAQSTTTIYARIDCIFTFNAFRIKSVPRFERDNSMVFLLVGLVLGIALIIGAISIPIGILMRDRAFLYFPFYVVFAILGAGQNIGTTSMFLWPDTPELKLQFGGLIFGIHMFWAALFVSAYLQCSQFRPRLGKVFDFLGLASLVMGIYYALVPAQSGGSMLYLISALITPLVLIAAWLRARDGYIPAMILLVAAAPLMISGLIQALIVFEFFSIPTWFFGTINLGYGFFFLVLAVGLAERFYEMRKRATQAHDALSSAQAETEAVEAISRERTIFFQNISHELRTPLTLILNPLEQASKRHAGDESIGIASRNARRLLRLVNQLLDFQKLEAGKKSITLSPVNLNQFAKVCGDYFASACSSKDIQFSLSLDGTQPVYVLGEVDAMEKVAFNYLSNALKFTPRGGTIELGVELEDTKYKTVKLSVRDSGPGISQDHISKLFKVFSQLDTSTTREHEGTGLGLALVKSLAEEMGAEVGVESTPGEGSTFFVRFGTVAAPDQPSDEFSFEVREWLVDESSKSSDADESETKSQGWSDEGQRILVVDDLSDMRNLISDALRSQGLQVMTANHGKRGFELAMDHTPDLIVTDWMMPVMSGPELIQTIRSEPTLRATPIVLLTAKSDEESKLAGTEIGADAFLGKPFNAQELNSTVRNLLALKSREREVQALNHQLTEQVLKRYLPPDLVESIVHGDAALVQEPRSMTTTILFSDIAGFTHFSGQVRAPKLARILNEYLQAMTKVIFAHNGTIDKFVGDAIMVIFGAPTESSPRDQAHAASNCALAMQTCIRELNENWNDPDIDELKMRIGIHQGPAVVGSFGSEIRSDYTAIGPTVNLASRIESACSPGEVFVSGEVCDFLPETAAEGAGVFELKGIANEQRLYRLVPTAFPLPSEAKESK